MLSPLSASLASSPLTAVTTSYLAASSLVRTNSRRLRSSSTTRIFPVDITNPLANLLSLQSMISMPFSLS